MTDKKLTDNEIMKALPFLAKYCKDEYNDIRVDKVSLGAFDLINRLKCERNKYRRKVQNQREEINRLKTENEMLKPFKSNLLKIMGDNIQKTKVEVVKEFAKLCIDKSQNGIIQVSDMPDYVIEMVGEDNA